MVSRLKRDKSRLKLPYGEVKKRKKMATAYLPEYEAFFNELINDEDSDSDFEGFELEEEGLMNVYQPEMNVVEDGFMRNWVEGDREPS